jgi:hypothetical protein
MQIHHLHDEMPEKSEHLRRDVINTMDVQLNPKTVRLESLSAMLAPNPPKRACRDVPDIKHSILARPITAFFELIR